MREPTHWRALVWPAVGSALVALAWRGLYLAGLRAEPALLVPILDSAAHLEWARGLLAGTWPGSEPFFRAPGYVVALAGELLVAGDDPGRVAALQVLLGAATPVLVALLAGRVFRTAAAWTAGVGAAVYPIFPFFDGQLLDPALGVPVTVAAALATVEAGRGGERTRMLSAGLWSVAAVVRPPLLLASTMLPLSLARRGDGRAAARTIAIILLLPLLVTARNAAVGDAVFIATQGGLNFYLGNGRAADGVAATFAEAPTALGYGMVAAAARSAEAREGRVLRPSEVSQHYMRRTVGEIADDPARWLALLVKKAVVFWGSREIPNNHDPALFAEVLPWMRWAPGWWFWAPLGVVGFALGWRRPGVPILAGIVAAVWLENVLFFGNGRFRIPAAPFLVVAGSRALIAIARGLRGRLVREATLALSGAAGLGLMMVANPYRIPHEIWPMSFVMVAEAERDLGEPVRALRWIERAVAAEPSLYPARFAQVQLLRRAGRTAEALAQVERLLEAWPRDAQLRSEHAVLLDIAGQSDAALAEIDAALALDPSLDAARVHRAVVLARLGRAGEARDALLAFLRERPASPEAARAREVLGGLER